MPLNGKVPKKTRQLRVDTTGHKPNSQSGNNVQVLDGVNYGTNGDKKMSAQHIQTKPARLKGLPSKPARAPELRGQPGKALPGIKSIVEKYDDLLQGHLEDLPPKPPTEVRIFLSSTFSDMRAERNWLAKEAYPQLKQLCADLDLDFQVVDMRWGVTDDATNEHITEKLCLAEVEKCQQLSVGPNFVSFLGDRYGFRPIPVEVPVSQYEVVLQEATALQLLGTELLKEWYIRDENALPPVYLLQPIRSKLHHFGNYSDGHEENRKLCGKQWKDIFASLQSVWRKAAKSALQKGLLMENQTQEFFTSVTECEIKKGIVGCSEPRRHVLCFLRSLIGLEGERLTDRDAGRFTETTNQAGKVVRDDEVALLRRELHTKTIPSLLPAESIYTYQVPWREGGVCGDTCEENLSYLKTLNRDFVRGISRLITEAQHQKQNVIPQSEYYTEYEEALHHMHFCHQKCTNFQGQKDTLMKIRAFLENPKVRKPLVLSADSGTGKTSVMAMVMKSIPEWFGNDCIRMIRFLGTHPHSTDIFQVLFGIAGQLADNLDMLLEPVGYKNMQSLVKYLPRFLRNASRTSKHPIFILLDSIDQLSPADGAYRMKWLPLELPSNIKIIISSLPQLHGCLDNLKLLLPDTECYITLPSLQEDTGLEIINAHLASKQRTLVDEQRKLVVSHIHSGATPLYLKLLLDRAVTWKSYTPVDDMVIASTVREAINSLFQGLESKYGVVLIKAALGYITVGLDGISEVELEDTLSCNDEVLNAVYQYHDPPVDGVVRIPPLLWARVQHDIAEYLTERRSQGKTTKFWYHRQFIEAAQDRYVGGADALNLHKDLAKMYLCEKGFVQTITLTKRKKTILNADRQVTCQEVVMQNRRMLVALPHHLINLKDFSFLKQKALCNLKFLMTKMAGISLDALIKDFMLALPVDGSTGDLEIELVLQALQDVRVSLRSPQFMPVELLSRLSTMGQDVPNIAILLDQATNYIISSAYPTLLPLYSFVTETKNTTTSVEHLSTEAVTDIVFSAKHIITSSQNNEVKFWKKESGLLANTICTPGPVHKMWLACKGEILITVNQGPGGVAFWEVGTGSEMKVGTDFSDVLAVELSKDTSVAYMFCKDASKSKIIIYDINNQTLVKTIMVNSKVPNTDLEMKLCSNGKFLVFKFSCGEKELEIIVKSEKRGNLHHVDCRYRLAAINLDKSETSLIPCNRQLSSIPTLVNSFDIFNDSQVLIGRERLILVWDIENGHCDQKMCKSTKIPMFFRPEWVEDNFKQQLCHGLTHCVLRSEQQDLVVCGSEDGWLMIYDAKTGLKVPGHLDPSKPSHSTPIHQVCISPDSRWVASASEDRLLKFWSVSSDRTKSEELFSMKLKVKVTKMIFSPDSLFLAIMGLRKDQQTVIMFSVVGGDIH